MATLVAANDLCTPARPDTTSTSDIQQTGHSTTTTSTTGLLPSHSNTVTPSEPKESLEMVAAAATESNGGAETESLLHTTHGCSSKKKKNARGLVSRRGRGFANPGQRSSTSRSTNASDDDYDPQQQQQHQQLQTLATVTAAAASAEQQQQQQPNAFETPFILRNSVKFSSQEEHDKNAFMELPEESSDLPLSSSKFAYSMSPTTDAMMGPTTPCRYNKDHDEKKQDYRASPPPQQRERDFFATTPTDFAFDYGKQQYPSSFDTSNVLAWLNSPNPNQLFSPGGGLASMLNSPRFVPRTPRTPTISTSFFFSDVASLPKNSDKGSGVKDSNGRENVICISPLASKTNTANTPMNLKDVFNSPARPCDGQLPLLSDTPLAKPLIGSASDKDTLLKDGGDVDGGSSTNNVLQQVQRDIMEDEDLSVLLQLAGNAAAAATAAAACAEKSSSSPTQQEENGSSVFRQPANMPDLQLPMNLGGKLGDGVEAPPKILRRKSSMRDDDGPVLPPPLLGMRSLSSGGANPNDFFSNMDRVGGGFSKADKTKSDIDSNPSAVSKSSAIKKKSNGGLDKLASLSAAAAASQQSMSSSPYSLALNMNHQDMHHYYNLGPTTQGQNSMPPGSIPPGAGSLRIVMGGPPPPNCQLDGTGSMIRPNDVLGPNGLPLYHGEYMNGLPASSYAPHPHAPPPGMYSHSQFGQPSMGYPHYPHPGHYPSHSSPPGVPARPQVPLFGSPPNSASTKNNQKSKTSKSASAGTKRPSLKPDETESSQAIGNPEKKPKKPRTDGPSKRKKNRSPQVADADKQKCAEAVLAVNAASGGKHDKEAELATAIMRGVTMRPSGKWQAQLYFAGKSRYIGVFDSREKAALAYEIAREKLKIAPPKADANPKTTENLVNAARKAAFDGVNEKLPS